MWLNFFLSSFSYAFYLISQWLVYRYSIDLYIRPSITWPQSASCHRTTIPPTRLLYPDYLCLSKHMHSSGWFRSGADNRDVFAFSWTLNDIEPRARLKFLSPNIRSGLSYLRLTKLSLLSLPLAINTNITVFGDAGCSDSSWKDLFKIILEATHFDKWVSVIEPKKCSRDDHLISFITLHTFIASWGKLMRYGNQRRLYWARINSLCPSFDRIPTKNPVSQSYKMQVSCLHINNIILFKLRIRNAICTSLSGF